MPSSNNGIIDHFNELSSTGRWSAAYAAVGAMNYHMPLRRLRVMELLPEQLGRVLDVGCGPGVFVEGLLRRGATYTGIDISPQMIMEAQSKFARYKNVEFRLGTIESLRLAANSYDHVIAVGLLEYLSDLGNELKAMFKVLRPGGTAVLTIPKRWHIDRLTGDLTAPARAIARLFAQGTSDGIPRVRLQPNELDQLSLQAGFRRVDGSLYYFTPFTYPLHRLAPKLCMKLNLPFNRWYKARDPIRSFFAHGYIGYYRKM